MIHNEKATPTAEGRNWLQKGAAYNEAEIVRLKSAGEDTFICDSYLSLIQGHLKHLDAKKK